VENGSLSASEILDQRSGNLRQERRTEKDAMALTSVHELDLPMLDTIGHTVAFSQSGHIVRL
jgi:hypothetical protein